tara:strand:+ start:544 stop:1473 length:930 start_codon:yes stop_codon:yes gene_type:complete
VDLFQNKFNKRELITLRTIFNSNSGLYKIINAGISLDEIKSLNQEKLKDLRFRNCDEVLNKLHDYESFETKAIEIIDWCDNENIFIISIFNEKYPKKLKMLKNPPCLLFCMGNVNLLSMEKSVAVVGSRDVSNYGNIITKKTTTYFAKNNINIVSGLAKGVDTQAHKAAISCKAPTTAVLVDIKDISPPSNLNLAEDIVRNDGLLVSENLPGTKASDSYLFIERNRIQTGLSKLVIIIEASANSGTKSTAKHAIEQKKPIYCSDLKLVQSYPNEKYIDSLNKKLSDQNDAKLFSDKTYDEMMEVIDSDS